MNDTTWQILREVAENSSNSSATFDQLAEEVMGLHLAIRGRHADTPALEWLKIATIAMNAFGCCLMQEQLHAQEFWRRKHLNGFL